MRQLQPLRDTGKEKRKKEEVTWETEIESNCTDEKWACQVYIFIAIAIGFHHRGEWNIIQIVLWWCFSDPPPDQIYLNRRRKNIFFVFLLSSSLWFIPVQCAQLRRQQGRAGTVAMGLTETSRKEASTCRSAGWVCVDVRTCERLSIWQMWHSG